MTAFPQAYAHDVDAVLRRNNSVLFETYQALDAAFAEGAQNAILNRKKKVTKIFYGILDPQSTGYNNLGAKHARDEFDVAKRFAEAEAAKKQLQENESRNADQAKKDGTIAECQCCWEEAPLNRMVVCDGELAHSFCYRCARSLAETQIGLSRSDLTCMSSAGCTAGFARDQQKLFLDQKLLVALERIDIEASLRMAGIENLETCPFCPYAAEYPPVSENKEFSCENEECCTVSCRLCREESHIPMTCEEAARENGHSARQIIEEAMSAALIRRCNKCKLVYRISNQARYTSLSLPPPLSLSVGS